jgi:CubicO group peptidase (beta-lactamase class C family)
MQYVYIVLFCLILGMNWILMDAKAGGDITMRKDSDPADKTLSDTAFYNELQTDKFMRRWLILGPISVSRIQEAQKEVFDPDLLMQHGGEIAIKPKPDLVYRVKDGKYRWQSFVSEYDTIDFAKIYDGKEYAIAYAWAEFAVSEEIHTLLGIGSDDAVKVWLNGKLVHENWVLRPLNTDDDIVPVTFRKGKNQILLKVYNEKGNWGFACRALSSVSLAEKLISAAGQGDLDAVKMLLTQGVDVNVTIGPGLTALHYAKIRGQGDVIEFLLKEGADPDMEMPSREEIVDMIFNKAIKKGTPGAALAVIQNGSVIYKKGYGVANMEYDVPITPSTIFHVASVSKQFTAFAVAMLADQGKLSLDDDIHKHLPEIPDFGKVITIRHLIHHTSGLRDQWELLVMAGFRLDDVITRDHIMKMVTNQKELNFDPGEENLYCNTGYTLLAEIVERVSGQSFREYTESEIFKPLGMTNTHFHDDHEMIVKNRAYSYASAGNGGFKKRVLSFANVGATSLFTTVEDLAKWIQNFHDGRVGGMDVIKQMHQRGVLNNGKELDYAFGLGIGKYRGLNTVGHGGADAGYRSFITWFPDQKLGMTVLSNLGSMNPGGMAFQVADVYLMDQLTPQKKESEEAEESKTDVDPELYDDYVGVYQVSGVTITITKENNRLMGEATGVPKTELVPESETTFLAKGANVRLTFQRDENGKVTQLIVNQDGQDIPAKRIESVPPTLDQFGEYVGHYYSDEIGATYTIAIQDDQLIAQHRRHKDTSLKPTAADQFSGNNWWFSKVDFERDADRKVTGFRLTGGRVRNLRFDRK